MLAYKGGSLQIDLHYHACYVIARIAGFNQEDSRIIATCSQFVDDSFIDEHEIYPGGFSFQKIVTAHHCKLGEGLFENLDRREQRMVWVPFHFFPGGEGDCYGEKLTCRADNKYIKKIKQKILKQQNLKFKLELIGIVSHVLLDSFSHEGFSGISSKLNEVKNNKIDILNKSENGGELAKTKLKHFKKKYKYELPDYTIISSIAGEFFSNALGHGAVATLPDLPYLKWKYSYENCEGRKKVIKRDNPKIFLKGLKSLYNFFVKITKNQRVKFEKIEDDISNILEVPGRKVERIKLWGNYIREIDFLEEENIPVYYGDIWLKIGFEKYDYESWYSEPFYKFHQAADYYKTFVLRELLPEEKIFVI